MLPQNRTESAPSCPKMGTLPKTQSSPAQERNPRSAESDRISPIMSENGMKRALKRLLGLCMADSALCFFLSGLYMARAPRYPRYGRCNSAPRTRHITFQVPHISHLAFPRPMNLPYIGEITSRQPLLRSAPHNRNPNIRQSHHTRPTSAPYHTTITHIPRKHSEKCRRFLSPIPRNPWGRVPPYYRKRQLMAIAGNPQRRQPMPLPSQVPQPAVIARRPQADTTQQPKTTK